MADLWLAHMQAAHDENGDAEIRQELDCLVALRNSVERKFNEAQAKQDVTNAIPQTIIEYLQIACPECEPIVVAPWEHDPKRFLVQTLVPMTPEAYAGLGSMYPGMLVVDYAPISRRTHP